MQGIETAIEMYERLRSELQDFVAENKFGWGHRRPDHSDDLTSTEHWLTGAPPSNTT